MERPITRPDGSKYMTAVYTGDAIEFRDFAKNHYTVRFDAKVLDQLVPFLNEIQFWRKANEKSD
jgi:hypothetical protein